MVGYVLFLVFLAVFAVLYLTRDKTQDAEKIRQCDLW
jgi:cbb3-type cytochrome oxidase subunit 3